jgi:hypothetical protein
MSTAVRGSAEWIERGFIKNMSSYSHVLEFLGKARRLLVSITGDSAVITEELPEVKLFYYY